jgi:predicted DsbA family dithiol-disulfide isomerase
MPRIRIDMIFDPSCPWCYIGKRQLQAAVRLREPVAVDVRWWPFLLHTDVPAAGVDRHVYLCRKYGSEGRLKRMQAAIADVGAGVGIAFAFDRIRRTPNTLLAHRLIRFAEVRGRGEPVLEAVFHAYFVAGRDIGEPAVLAAIGAEAGFEPRVLRAFLTSSAEREGVLIANERAHRLGINGVPTFVFDRRLVICGAQEPMTLARMLDAARELRQLAARLPGAPAVPRMSTLPDADIEG